MSNLLNKIIGRSTKEKCEYRIGDVYCQKRPQQSPQIHFPTELGPSFPYMAFFNIPSLSYGLCDQCFGCECTEGGPYKSKVVEVSA